MARPGSAAGYEGEAAGGHGGYAADEDFGEASADSDTGLVVAPLPAAAGRRPPVSRPGSRAGAAAGGAGVPAFAVPLGMLDPREIGPAIETERFGDPDAAMASGADHSWGLGSGVWDESGPRIKVVVRKRPLSRKELRARELDVVQTGSRRTLTVHEPKQKVDLTRYTEMHTFTFDEVFDAGVGTEVVYRHTAQPLVGGIFRGANATCFAYGQTGESECE